MAKAALNCAHRTSTVSPFAFCEQGGHLAAPSSSFLGRALREHGDRPSYPPFFSILLKFDCHQVPPHHYLPSERFSCLLPHIVSFGDGIQMRQHKLADSGFSSHLPTLTGM